MPRKVQFKTPWGCCYIDPRYVVAVGGEYVRVWVSNDDQSVRDVYLVGGQTMTILDDPDAMQVLLDAGDPK